MSRCHTLLLPKPRKSKGMNNFFFSSEESSIFFQYTYIPVVDFSTASWSLEDMEYSTQPSVIWKHRRGSFLSWISRLRCTRYEQLKAYEVTTQSLATVYSQASATLLSWSPLSPQHNHTSGRRVVLKLWKSNVYLVTCRTEQETLTLSYWRNKSESVHCYILAGIIII